MTAAVSSGEMQFNKNESHNCKIKKCKKYLKIAAKIRRSANIENVFHKGKFQICKILQNNFIRFAR